MPLNALCLILRGKLHSRSKASRTARNRKIKSRQKRNKGTMKRILSLASKDNEIEKLEKELNTCKKALMCQKQPFRPPKTYTTSCVRTIATFRATSANFGKDINTSRDALISAVCHIPRFENGTVAISTDILGRGQFGTVKKARIHKLGITVAAKISNSNAYHKKAVLAETIVGLTLSGHDNFPFCFGLLHDNTILMELFSGSSDLLSRLNSGITVMELRDTCLGVLKAIEFMHHKKLLHNDIKADNVVLAQTTKVIDFGKATLISRPRQYNILPGSKENLKYNKFHRHLAHELRNLPGSKQSVATDLYSIGYLFKHSAAYISYQPIIELGRLMKCIEPASRISIVNAIDKMKMF